VATNGRRIRVAVTPRFSALERSWAGHGPLPGHDGRRMDAGRPRVTWPCEEPPLITDPTHAGRSWGAFPQRQGPHHHRAASVMVQGW